jgi:hypothetical protein
VYDIDWNVKKLMPAGSRMCSRWRSASRPVNAQKLAMKKSVYLKTARTPRLATSDSTSHGRRRRCSSSAAMRSAIQ